MQLSGPGSVFTHPLEILSSCLMWMPGRTAWSGMSSRDFSSTAFCSPCSCSVTSHLMGLSSAPSPIPSTGAARAPCSSLPR